MNKCPAAAWARRGAKTFVGLLDQTAQKLKWEPILCLKTPKKLQITRVLKHFLVPNSSFCAVCDEGDEREKAKQ